MSAYYYYHEGKFNNALEKSNLLQGLDPGYATGAVHWNRFYIYLKQQQELKGVEELQKALEMATMRPEQAPPVNEIYNRSGINGILNLLIELQLQKPNASLQSIARFYVIIEQKEEPLDCLEKAVERRELDIARINVNPDYDFLRSDPRFQALIRKMGLSEYSR